MTTTTSRRAILAGAAALPALAASAAFAATGPDPIFAAIERHKVTFKKRMEAGRAHFDLSSSDSQYEKLIEADEAATDEDFEAAYALVDIQPTTITGVLALIDYVNEFNRGNFRVDDDWHSAAYNWPSAELLFSDDDGVNDPDGECGMVFAVLLNVRDALQSMVVQS